MIPDRKTLLLACMILFFILPVAAHDGHSSHDVTTQTTTAGSSLLLWVVIGMNVVAWGMTLYAIRLYRQEQRHVPHWIHRLHLDRPYGWVVRTTDRVRRWISRS